MKTALYIIYGLLFLMIGVLVARFVLGGPEDSWVCTSSGWVKHGNPAGPMPTSGCVIPGVDEEELPRDTRPD